MDAWIERFRQVFSSRLGFYLICLFFILFGILSASQCTTAVALYKRERMLKMANEKIAQAVQAAIRMEAHAESSLKAYAALSAEVNKRIQLSQQEAAAIEEKKRAMTESLAKEKKAIKKMDLKGVLHAFRDLGY